MILWCGSVCCGSGLLVCLAWCLIGFRLSDWLFVVCILVWFAFGLLVLRAAFVLDGVAVVPGGLRLVDSGLV